MLHRLRLDLLAISLAVLGGSLGILGALMQEFQAVNDPLTLIVIGAPVIEETLKPAGIYILLARWPQALRGRWHAAILTALSGLVFGLIESWVYVTFYVDDPGHDYILFRFTVPVAMHTIASMLVGMGLTTAMMAWVRGSGPLPRRTRNFTLAGMGLHAAYNLVAIILAATGTLEFDDDTGNAASLPERPILRSSDFGAWHVSMPHTIASQISEGANNGNRSDLDTWHLADEARTGAGLP